MLRYEVPEDFLTETKAHHRSVQQAISIFANEALGIQGEPRGIHSAEGGVKVRNVNVKIKRSYVLAQPASADPTDEERAVVLAINRVVGEWRKKGAAFFNELPDVSWAMGDPLSDFYSPIGLVE